MKLPRALAPWAAHLAPIESELRLVLGGLVQQLSLVVQPARASLVGATEPDGYSGISRNGPYERLLASEWAMLAEHADEFIRRAAMREHLFLELRREQETRGRKVVALFDAGPSQIGNPRLVHLAMLLLLDAWCAAHKAEFYWGILQGPERDWHRDAGKKSIKSLLAGRTWVGVQEEHLAAWWERLSALAPVSDLWVVGGPGVAGSAGRASTLIVTEPLIAEPGVPPAIGVVVTQAGRERRASLELPTEQAAVSLLTSPLAQQAEPAPSPRRASSWRELPVKDLRLFISPGGGSISLCDGHRVRCFAAPDRNAGLNPRSFKPSWRRPIVGVCVFSDDGGGIATISVESSRAQRSSSVGQGGTPPPTSEYGHFLLREFPYMGKARARWPDSPPTVLLASEVSRRWPDGPRPCMCYRHAPGDMRVVLVDALRRLVMFRTDAGERRAEALGAADVLSLCVHGVVPAVARCQGHGVFVETLGPTGREELLPGSFGIAHKPRPGVVWGPVFPEPTFPLRYSPSLAIESETDAHWLLFHKGQTCLVRVEPGSQPLALLHRRGAPLDRHPGEIFEIISLSPDGRRLFYSTPRSSDVFCTLPAPAQEVAVAHATGRIVALLKDGSIASFLRENPFSHDVSIIPSARVLA